MTIALIAVFTGCDTPRSDVPEALEELTIADIHKAYEEGKYNSRQLVEAYINRIESFDSEINALTIVNPDALHEAEKLDREYGETAVLRPLHGIPLIVKDNINTRGLPTTGG